MLEGSGTFDRANATGKLALNSSAASLAQITGLIAPLAPSVASRLNAMGLGRGAGAPQARARPRQGRRAAPIAPARAPRSTSTRRSSRAPPRSRHKPEAAALREIDLDKLRQSEISLESKLSSEQGAVAARLARARRHDRGGRRSGAIPGLGDRRVGRAAAAQDQSHRARASTPRRRAPPIPCASTAQGQRRLEGAQPQSRAAVRSQAVRQARAKHQPVVARVAARRQADLRGSGQRDGGFAAARPRGGDARRRTQGRGRSRPRRARSCAGLRAGDRCRRARRGRAVRLRAVEGLARADRVSGVARACCRAAASCARVSGTVKGDGQSLVVRRHQGRHRRRRGERQYRRQADRERPCAECAPCAQRRRRRRLALSRARDARRPRLVADDAGKPGPQRVGADRRALGQRHRDAGIRRASPVSIRAPSMSRSAPATPARRPTTSGCARSSSRRCRAARCWSPRRKFRSRSGTAGFASAPPRSMPKSPAPSFPVATIFPPIRPISARPLTSAAAGQAASRPEIQMFAAGSPDALDRTVDVAALSSWLAVRAIDRETRRLDSIERGEPTPASIAGAGPAGEPAQATRAASRRRRSPRLPASDEADARPRSAPVPPSRNPPAANAPPPANASSGAANAPVVSQQVPPPLPPPIEVRPAPSVVARPPKPKPPLVLTPPPARVHHSPRSRNRRVSAAFRQVQIDGDMAARHRAHASM